MSRQQPTLTRAEALRLRREEEERRKAQRGGLKKPAASRPVAGFSASRPPARAVSVTPRLSAGGTPRRFNAAFSRPAYRNQAQVVFPQISLPQVSAGPRWISFLLLSLFVAGLYLLLNSDPFIVRRTIISGNQRLSAAEIDSVLGVLQQPAVLLNPAQVEYNVLTVFPEIAAVWVEISLPAEVKITVQERLPIAAWVQDGNTLWVDAAGYAFPPRGEDQSLMLVQAAGAPPAPSLTPEQAAGAPGAKPFLPPSLAQGLTTIRDLLPEGASLVYDPRYGLGWNDPGGWQAYFGASIDDLALKLQIYQALVRHLTSQEIHPALISVEYPAAPYYRLQE